MSPGHGRDIGSYAGGVRPPEPLPTWAQLRSLAVEHGIDHLGVTSADVLDRARRALHDRKAAGLDGGMAFTYRNPDRSTDPQRTVVGARSIIVGAHAYWTEEEPPRTAGPQARVARYAWVDHYAPLRAGLQAIVRRLKDAGERAVAVVDDKAMVDREVAHRAGLGWFGKNANLLLSGAGSWFVLGSVITTAAYEPAETVAPDGCGSCRRCIDACPTGAIVAPGVIDANRCLAWVLQRPGSIPEELRTAIGDRIYGCDDCQESCPPTVRLGRRHRVPLAPDSRAWVDVLELLDADDATLLERHGHWYIAGRDPRWLRRNALVVLGNCADPQDPRVALTLARYRHGGDSMLTEHAEWASTRLGLVSTARP